MKIYTRKGDLGETSLFGGTRVLKDDVRVECYGTFDEANSTIGLLRAKLSSDHSWQANLHRIQRDMMAMMSLLATPSNSPKENTTQVPMDGAAFCEAWIDALEQENASPTEYFLLPGGNEISALCHVVRTQIRRSERRLVSLMKIDTVHEAIPAYINRLSDLFFMLARVEMSKTGLEEERWKHFVYKKKKE